MIGSANVLTLTVSGDGIYQAGSYYDYLKTVVETSLNHFLEDTTFPYTVASGGKGGFDGGLPELTDGEMPDGAFDFGKGSKGEEGKGGRGFGGTMAGELPERNGDLPALEGDLPDLNGKGGNIDYEAIDGIDRVETTGGISLSGTYETV